METKSTRREWLKWLAMLPVSARAAVAGAAADEAAAQTGVVAGAQLPDKASFGEMAVTYLDSGSTHPISIGAHRSLQAYIAKRSVEPHASHSVDPNAVCARFARLINAETDEIAWVPSTTAGELLVVKGLGLPARGAQVVTDTLHFFGSFYLYEELARQGVEVTWLRPIEGRITPDSIERAVRRGTRLVALSAVSTFNGFEHDLKRVCEVAHAHGALVYADIVHAAGCVPFDVKACGVDFAACASYKWLMADFGLGFLYIRRGLWDRFQRSQWGYYALQDFQTHVYPFDPPGKTIADCTPSHDANGLVALGTHSYAGVALLDHSLDYLLATGVQRIQAHAQTLTDRLKRELPRLGYSLLTPVESRAPIVACALENAHERLSAKLEAASIRITLARNRFRVTPSVFNDDADIDRLLSVLAG